MNEGSDFIVVSRTIGKRDEARSLECMEDLVSAMLVECLDDYASSVYWFQELIIRVES